MNEHNLSNVRKGKWAETKVIAELLKENYDIYSSIADDKGIDLVVRLKHDQYVDIQVKGSTKESKKPEFFAFRWNKGSRKNYFFVFYSETKNTFWVIPTEYMTGKEGKEVYGVDRRGYCSVNFGIPKHRNMFKTFENNWKIISTYLNKE